MSKKVWNEDYIFNFRYKTDHYGLANGRLPLKSIYKFGFYCVPQYGKRDKDKIVGVKLVGYIITTAYKKLDGIYPAHIRELRSIGNKYGNIRIYKKERNEYSIDSRKVVRLNTEYLLKTQKNEKFKSLIKKVGQKGKVKKKNDYLKREKNTEYWDNIGKKRRESGFYENRKPRRTNEQIRKDKEDEKNRSDHT